MTIKVGDAMPNGTLKIMSSEGSKDLTTAQLFDG